MTEAPAQPQPQPQEVSLSIVKLYLKDLSLEVPHAPQVFLERDAPAVEVKLHTAANRLDAGLHEAVLTVTVTARSGEKVFFLVEAAQAGIFRMINVGEAEAEMFLGSVAPGILFPYARQVISDATSQAGFPPVVLDPVNFESIFLQKRQAPAAEPAAAPAVAPAPSAH